MTVTARSPVSVRYTITIQAGPDRGGTYQLIPPRISIGRGPDNDIVLVDPRCSRSHVIIEFKGHSILIQDISGKNTMAVNGEIKTQSELSDGDVISLGDSEVLFKAETVINELMVGPGASLATTPVHAPFHPSTVAPPPSMTTGPRPGPFPASRSTASVGSKKLRFYLIILIVGALIFYLLDSEPPASKQNDGIRSAEDAAKEILDAENRVSELMNRRQFGSEAEKTRHRESHIHYLQGFRDYHKGQYGRAMKSFETARALDPANEMAERYHELSRRKIDELVALHMLEGRRYKEKNMHSRCSASMEKVMGLLRGNPDDAKYKEAMTLKMECDLLSSEGGL